MGRERRGSAVSCGPGMSHVPIVTTDARCPATADDQPATGAAPVFARRQRDVGDPPERATAVEPQKSSL